MYLSDSVDKLRRHGDVYLFDSPIFDSKEWGEYQRREKSFWYNKINHTEYNPNPKDNFIYFFDHWGIEKDYFKGKSVLEIGSGPFGFFAGLKMMGEEYLPENLFIIDSLMDYYQQFHLFKLMPNQATKVQAPGEDIPFPDHSFDIILTTNTIDHVSNCDTFLNEVHRLLKPQGEVLFSVHSIPNSMGFLKSFLKKIDHNHPYHFTKTDVFDLFAKNQFEIKHFEANAVIKEDKIPKELSLLKKMVYQFGYRIMRNSYGRAYSK